MAAKVVSIPKTQPEHRCTGLPREGSHKRARVPEGAIYRCDCGKLYRLRRDYTGQPRELRSFFEYKEPDALVAAAYEAVAQQPWWKRRKAARGINNYR